MSATKSQFRYDINGLRAIAILGVLLFHYKVTFLSGGFAGVDVFFVISGFLMSKIIITSIEKGDFSFWSYLGKRLKRIVPALLVLLLGITVIGFFVYFPEDYKLNERNSASSVFFLSNILYWRSTNYFAPASDTNILLHTWSLSVEWQFYLLYPFIMLLVMRVLKQRISLKAFFILITFVLFLFSVYYVNIDATAAFYLLPTRAWEMLIGGIAFLFEDSLKNRKIKSVFAGVGYGLIFVSFLVLEPSKAWPSYLTLLPVAGTLLVIIANQNNLLFIKNAVVQFIGKISYSLYLWHWPIYVVAQYYLIKVDAASITVFIVLAVLTGFLSYKYVESAKYDNYKSILAAMVFVFVTTATLSKINSNLFLFKSGTIKIAGYQTGHEVERRMQYREDTCHVANMQQLKHYKDLCLCRVDGQKNILLIGDSHMGQLAQSFIQKGKEKNIHFLQATVSATLPTFNDYQHKDKDKRKVIDYMYQDFIPKNLKSIDGVIITGSWSGYKSIKSDSVLLKGVKETIEYFRKYNLKTVIIGQTERYIHPFPVFAARDFERSTKSNSKYLDSRSYDVDKLLARNLGDEYISVINLNSFPHVSQDHVPYMIDDQHVSKYGADLLVKKLFSNPKFLTQLNIK